MLGNCYKMENKKRGTKKDEAKENERKKLKKVT